MKIPKKQEKMSPEEAVMCYVKSYQHRLDTSVSLTDEEFRQFVELYKKPGTMLGAEVRDPIFYILEKRARMEENW